MSFDSPNHEQLFFSKGTYFAFLPLFFCSIFFLFLCSLQYGCCMPPAECGYTYINPTYWLTPNNTAASMDCLQWSNDQMQLCFHCDSCKAGLLANLTKEWRSVDIILLITLVVLICVYLIGFCCALRKSKPGDGDTSPRRNKENT